MSLTGRSRIVILATLVVLGLVAAGVAAAYVGGVGSGSASADTGATQSVSLGPATPEDQLYPGGEAGVAVTITNPNPGPVRVGSLALDTSEGSGGFAVDGGHSGCGLETLAFATQSNGGAGWTVPGSGSLSITLSGALSMTSSAANACQGASFTVYLAAGA